ncbi:Putative Holin-X, holin superfamily III [Actinopolyspora lacussalsi subsp. righensis]|uniref:Putative Holin-X, holin superfamily III n=1 Tax=Actinopolyspora righensis TaxID=995060 RepID=A0A1I7BQM4_9ACTN|nr:Putative Holin-X, holin superfamily III [Actinopolyspora righensis]
MLFARGTITSVNSSQNKQHDGAGTTAESAVTSIPLSEEGTGSGGEQSIGSLGRDVATHLSSLVRGELELAKAEISNEARKALKGSVYFVLALTVLAFSSFFLFFTLAEGLHALGLWRWASFGIVFLVMLLVTIVLALFGYRRVRKISAPRRTMDSLRETAQLRHRHSQDSAERPQPSE